MKRSDALKPLSRDHHHALVTAKRLYNLHHEDPEKAADYWRDVRQSLSDELSAHFHEEEEGFGHLLTGRMKQRFLDDHATLRKLLEDKGSESILLFARCLKNHVRFEERELFGWLEQNHGQEIANALL